MDWIPPDPEVVDRTSSLLRQGPRIRKILVHAAHTKNTSAVENHKGESEQTGAWTKLQIRKAAHIKKSL